MIDATDYSACVVVVRVAAVVVVELSPETCEEFFPELTTRFGTIRLADTATGAAMVLLERRTFARPDFIMGST